MTEAELVERYPEIPWREPVEVITRGQRGLACRLCVATIGLHAKDIGKLPQTPEEFEQHLAVEHP